MEILKGTVKEPGYPPVPDVYYAKIDDQTLYYFIPNGKMANGNIIVSTNLKEAVGHAPHTSLGYIDPKGNLLIPCEHKTLKQVGNKEDNILLAEKSTPTSESVTAIIKSMSNPANQQAIEENSKKIKDQMIEAMGMSGDFIFDNQCSEAALYTMSGINVSNGYYSFISELNSNYYFATNVPGEQILTFNPSMLQQQEPEQLQAEPEAMPNIDIPIQQQVENNGELNQQGMDMPPQVEPEFAKQITQTADIEKLEQANAQSVNNIEAEERLDQIMGFANKDLDDSSQEKNAETREVAEERKETGEFEDEPEADKVAAGSEETGEFEDESEADKVATGSEETGEFEDESEADKVAAESKEDDEFEDESEADKVAAGSEEDDEFEDESEADKVAAESKEDDEFEDESEEDEITAESEEDDEFEDESEEDEITAESKEDDEFEDEAEEENETNDKIEAESEEQEKGMDLPNLYKLNDEDIATPVIRDATQTIINIVGENRKLRQELDKRDGKISILESNLEILNEDVRAKDEENKLLRQELEKERQEKALYKSQTAESNRESIKLRGALERQVDINKDKDRQVKELLGQVAGLSNLNNAVMEANALVQPVENNSENNLIYGDFNYLGNAKSKSKAA